MAKLVPPRQLLSLVFLCAVAITAQASPPVRASGPWPAASSSGTLVFKNVCALHACALSSVTNAPGQPKWPDGLAHLIFRGNELTSDSRQALAVMAREARAGGGKIDPVVVRVRGDVELPAARAQVQARARALSLVRQLDGLGVGNEVSVSY
jgi:hypothetical protein